MRQHNFIFGLLPLMLVYFYGCAGDAAPRKSKGKSTSTGTSTSTSTGDQSGVATQTATKVGATETPKETVVSTAEVVAACDNKKLGETETRVRSLTESVRFGEVCTGEVQTRVCESAGWASWSGTYTVAKCVVTPADKVGLACPVGTYDAVSDKCKAVETVTINLDSEWIQKVVCSDSSLVVSFVLEANTSQIKVSVKNSSGTWVTGSECTSGSTTELGVLNVKDRAGRDISKIQKINSFTYEYDAFVTGCNAINGGISHDLSKTIFSCFGTRKPTVKIRAYGEANLTIDGMNAPTCAADAFPIKGECYKSK